MLAAGCVLAMVRGSSLDWAAPSPEAALAEALGRRGLACEAADVTWLDAPRGVGGAIAGRSRALVRASGPGQGDPTDLYLVEGRLSPEGAVLWVGDVWDVTNTSGADESRPIASGSLAAYTTSADGLITGVHVLDLQGPPADALADFTRTQRLQSAITNLQQTGQTAGIAHTAFALDPVAARVDLSWRSDGMLEARTDMHAIVVDARSGHAARVLEGADFVRVVPDERAQPGNLVTWAVDRVRALSWFGDDRMQWVKAVAFTALDKVRATFAHGTTAEEVRDEIGLPASLAASSPIFADPDVGWPPAPIVPLFPSPLPGEGRWIALDKDPFITPAATGAAPAFVTSFVRPDRQRPDVRVYVTLWDPRQVALHMEAGTVEPISATGEHGSGMIPRVPEVMGHVVAAFNGGFQAQHGEYGMQANGIAYLPPKPYGATVVELRDGSNGFGAWPDSAEVPSDVIGLRQNLTAMVEDGRYNPWGRNWWGGAPPGWPDQIHTARSSICLTREGFAGYFYSASISPEDLGQAMLAARCSFGIHLDMNLGHAGFEFYDVAPEGELAPIGRPLQGDWEAQGKVPDMPGYVFRGRRMIRGMGHMLFPRYIQREARDFFYLTARTILPGAPVPSASPGAPGGVGGVPGPDEGQWRTRGLPQHGFPYAIATAWVRERPDLKLRVVRADPRTMRPAPIAEVGPEPTVLSLTAPAAASRAARTLWWHEGLFAIGSTAPGVGSEALLGGCAAGDACAAGARAGLGIQDEDGMLVWVELPADAKPGPSTAAAIDGLLARLGCSGRMAVPGRAQALLGGALDAAGDPVAGPSPPTPTVRLVRASAPDAHPIFTDTPIVPIQVWQPLQMKRVRYFSKPPPPKTP
ncbi:MAG TPA: hypothetical protein VH044_17560 [Polyangiaceae bacterium]|nr:hypothetical protein [Polyangiaceae bacterium]